MGEIEKGLRFCREKLRDQKNRLDEKSTRILIIIVKIIKNKGTLFILMNDGSEHEKIKKIKT